MQSCIKAYVIVIISISLSSLRLDIQQQMCDRLASSYHSVSNNTWANSECLHDKCDHLMSLRLIKRLSHLTGDGEDVMK